MIKPIKYGVVRVGYLGSFHIPQLKKISPMPLIGVFDNKKNNALFLELDSFVKSIMTNTKTLASRNSGFCALKIATKI